MDPPTERNSRVDYNGKILDLIATYERDSEQPHTFVLCLTATLDGADVVSSTSITIEKDRFLGGDFHEIMDIRSQETMEFATTLFDGAGRLRKEIVQPGSARRGTGVWGHELDKGSLALIEIIHVREPYLGQGYGKWMLQQVLAQPEVQTCNFAYAWPCAMGAMSGEEFATATARASHIFASAGFRRVGRSSFVAYALKDLEHPSRSLAAAEDAEMLKTDNSVEQLLSVEEMNDLDPAHQRDRELDVLSTRYPLHFSIMNDPEEAALATISRLIPEDSAALRQKDFSGLTPLHIAAVRHKGGSLGFAALIFITDSPPQSLLTAALVEKLLQTNATADLTTTDNQGRTPLELLDGDLTSSREFSRMVGIVFTGYPAEAMKTKAILLAAMGRPSNLASDGTSFGCTCGQCLSGFMSPRMRKRLHTAAEVAADIIIDTIPSTEPRQPLEPGQIDEVYMGEYIPSEIRRGDVYVSYIKGFANCFHTMACILQQDTLPTVAAVSAKMSGGMAYSARGCDHRHTSHYFQYGGLVDHALNALITQTQEDANGEDEVWADEIAALPACANDDDYQLVRDQLGLTGEFHGPERSDRDFDEEMIDSDDDDEW